MTVLPGLLVVQPRDGSPYASVVDVHELVISSSASVNLYPDKRKHILIPTSSPEGFEITLTIGDNKTEASSKDSSSANTQPRLFVQSIHTLGSHEPKTILNETEYDAILKKEQYLYENRVYAFGDMIICHENIKSFYLDFLPDIFHNNDFVNRLLRLFQEIWEPLELRQSFIDHYFDSSRIHPDLIPFEHLKWLRAWAHTSTIPIWIQQKDQYDIALHELSGSLQRCDKHFHISKDYYLREDSISLDKRRSAQGLLWRKGTISGLRDLLFLYTGHLPTIHSSSANVIDIVFGSSISISRDDIKHLIERYKPARCAYTLDLKND